MYIERIIGFDLREMHIDPAINLDRSDLYNPNVETVLTVDRFRWKSSFFDKETFNSTVPPELGTFNRFWRSLDAMNDFLRQQTIRLEGECWQICITGLVPEEYLEQIYGGPFEIYRIPLEDDPPNSTWKLLGYDVQDDLTFTHGLGQVLLDAQLREEGAKLWAHHLNNYHLFTNQEAAIRFCEWLGEYYPAAGRFMIFGLYYIASIP